MIIQPGNRIDNRYVVQEKLGQGGMGAVWKATDSRVGDEVVLKLPLNHNDPEILRRFGEEARTMRRFSLDSTNILDIQDIGNIDGVPYYVMRYLSGGSLRDWQLPTRDERNHVGDGTVFRWLSSIAMALDFIHSEGCLHRDIKPENILFNRRGVAYLVDFGIVKTPVEATTMTQADQSPGTLAYMPPEVLLGEQEISGKADQYALAVTLYEVLAGHRPYSGATSVAVYQSIDAGHRPLCEVNADISASASLALDRALSSQSTDRYDHCQQLADAFIAGLTSGPVMATTVKPKRTSPARKKSDPPVVASVVKNTSPPNPANQADSNLTAGGNNISATEKSKVARALTISAVATVAASIFVAAIIFWQETQLKRNRRPSSPRGVNEVSASDPSGKDSNANRNQDDGTATFVNSITDGKLDQGRNPQSNNTTPVDDGKIPRLTVGHRAPQLQVSEWLQGTPIKRFQPGHVYVVDFWTSWCAPCRPAILHLTDLQDQYRDNMTVISISISLDNESKDVQEFLDQEVASGKRLRDTLTHHIAIDDQADWKGTAATTFLHAAGATAVPTAFIIAQDGVIDWIGHPAKIDEPLKQIIASTWDRSAALAQHEQDFLFEQQSVALQIAFKNEDFAGAIAIIDEVLVNETNNERLLTLLAARFHALAKTEKSAQMTTTEARLVDVESKVIEDAWSDGLKLAQIANYIVNQPDRQDLNQALKAAKRSVELQSDNPEVLALLAHTYYASGKFADAVHWQQRANVFDKSDEQQAVLDKYKKAWESQKGMAAGLNALKRAIVGDSSSQD